MMMMIAIQINKLAMLVPIIRLSDAAAAAAAAFVLGFHIDFRF